MNWEDKVEDLQRWKEGKTGLPLIDALMREMNESGFMPNRGRMVAASYLTHDLRIDWREGAAHFEEKLIDHDVTSNYGGWNWSAGIGSGRPLIFNALKQSKDHDKKGDYIRTWVKELSHLPTEYIHDPWNMAEALQKASKVIIGKDYPSPINCLKYTDPDAAKKLKRS